MMESLAIVFSSKMALSCSAKPKDMVSTRYPIALSPQFHKTRRSGLNRPATSISAFHPPQSNHSPAPLRLSKSNRPGEMAQTNASYPPSTTKGILYREISCRYRVCKHDEVNLTKFRLSCNSTTVNHNVRKREKKRNSERERQLMVQCTTSSSSSSTEEVELDVNTTQDLDGKNGDRKGQFGDLVRDYGWKVRRMVEEQSEMRKVAQVQAEAFYVPVFLFNDLFFQFFQAEVLSGLLYKLRNSAPNRYACLVAESNTNDLESRQGLVGVVDVTALRDEAVLRHLSGAKEYLYVSGIAVLNTFRRRKVATALLKACDMVSILWGFEYLVLRAYEDDLGALKLYGNAGYRIVSADPPWMSTWIGRKCRVLMIKRPSSCSK